MVIYIVLRDFTSFHLKDLDKFSVVLYFLMYVTRSDSFWPNFVGVNNYLFYSPFIVILDLYIFKKRTMKISSF